MLAPLGHVLVCNTTTKWGRTLEKQFCRTVFAKNCFCMSKQSQYIFYICFSFNKTHFSFNIITTEVSDYDKLL